MIGWSTRPRVAGADGEDGSGDRFRSGRLAGRDRAGYRRLDGGIIRIRKNRRVTGTMWPASIGASVQHIGKHRSQPRGRTVGYSYIDPLAPHAPPNGIVRGLRPLRTGPRTP